MVSEVRHPCDIRAYNLITPHNCHRCCADRKNLDGPDCPRRSHQHTDHLLDALSLEALWDDYGIVGDLLVCPQLPDDLMYQLLT